MKRYTAILALAFAPLLFVACDSDNNDEDSPSINRSWQRETTPGAQYLFIGVPSLKSYSTSFRSFDGLECYEDMFTSTLVQQDDRVWSNGGSSFYRQGENLVLDNGLPDIFQRIELDEEGFLAQFPNCFDLP